MKILFICHERNLNGASRSLINIISVLEKEHELYALTCYSDGDMFNALKKHKVTILVYPYATSIKSKNGTLQWIFKILKYNLFSRFQNFVTVMKLAALVKEKGIELVHSNTGIVDIGGMIADRAHIPHIWHLREFGDLDFSMYPATLQPNYRAWMEHHVDRFICISKAIYNYYDCFSDNKKVVIYNGVDKSNILEKFYRRDTNVIKFLISGRILETKGQYEAVEACRILLSQGVRNFELHIAGSGKFDIPVTSKLMNHIVLHGLVNDMPVLRREMDVELVCSRAEAFGRVTAEAMMGGMPVIGSATGGTVELIEHGHTGFLYPKGEFEKLANYMKSFITSPDTIETMGRNAQRYACEHFTIERCVSELLEVYHEVLSVKS